MSSKRVNNKIDKSILTRRAFLRTASMAGAGALLAACAPAPAVAPPAPTAPAATQAPIATQVPIATPVSVVSTATPAATDQPTATPQAASGAEKILVFAAEAIGETLEPGLWNGFGNSNIIDNVYDRLTQPGPGWVGAAQPALAESWEISSDAKEYIFKIRKGVKFHDGTEVNADAIVRSLNRMTDDTDSSFVKGMYMNAEYGNANWEKLEKIDDMTVKLTLKAPDAAQLHRLYHPAAAIMSVKAMDKFGAGVGLNAVGAGPFKLGKSTPGQEATLVAFDDYWQGRPKLDKIVFRGYPDEAAMIAAIIAGEVNYAPYPPSASIEQFKKNEQLTVKSGSPLINIFVGLNRLQAPMDKLEVRQAINYAINRQNVIDGALYGLGILPASFLSPSEFGYDDAGLKISVHDPEKAKAALVASGLTLPVEITFSYENNRFWPQIAELIKADLEVVGFKVTLEKLDASAYFSKVTTGTTQLNMTQRSVWYPDPDGKMRLLHSSQASAQSETGVAKSDMAAKYDALVDGGRTESDPDKRKVTYKKLQDLILEDLPYVILTYYQKPYVFAKNVNMPDDAAYNERIFLRTVDIQ